MKKLNLISVLTVSLALLVGTSGCHHHPTKVTDIPGVEGPQGQTPGESNPSPGNGVPNNPEATSSANPTGIADIHGKWGDLANGPHNEDSETLKMDTVHFDFDKATIKPSEESKLQDVASYMKSHDTIAIRVEGNCDERGTEKYNLSLGERRALAVREYLANLGVDPQRIFTQTYGASRPVDPEHNETAWAKNRRADFVILSPK